jgi:PAS domain S-box-containing protein
MSKLLRYLQTAPAAGIGAFLFLLSLTQLVTYQHYLLFKTFRTTEMDNAANLVKEKLETALTNSLSATRTLSFIVKKYGVQNDFDSVAKQLMESNKYIDEMELVEGGVITKIYPLKGNESAIGLNILTTSANRLEALKAIGKRELFFAGPLELKQGGLGIVGRLPIFFDDEFWGFAAVVIRLPTLISAAGIDTLQNGDYRYQLSKINPTTGKEEFFLPGAELFKNETPVSVDIPSGEWKIYVLPRKSQFLITVLPFFFLGLITSIIGGVVTYFIFKQPVELKKLVDEKTALLQSSEENYRTTLERVSDAFVAVDTNWRFTYMNHRAGEIFNSEPKKIIGKDIWKEFRDIISEPLSKAYHQAMVEQRYIYREEFYPSFNGWLENHIYPSPNGLSVFFKDVTERKKVENDLKESEARFRRLIQEIPEAIFTCDAEGYLALYNKAAANLWGLEPKIGKHRWGGALKVFDKNGLEIDKEQSPMAITLKEGKKFFGEEFIIERPDGSRRNVLSHPSLLRDAEGDVAGAVNVLIDITERKKAEQELAFEKENSDAIINSLPGVFYLYNTSGKFLRWNKNFETVSGYSYDEVSGMHPLDFFEGEDKEIIKAKIAEVFSTGKAEIESFFVTKTGQKLPYYFNGHSDKFQGIECLIGMGIDISERKKVEEAMRLSEEKYRYLFNNNPALIFIWDPVTLKLLEYNDIGVQEFGYSRQELENMTLLDFRDPAEHSKVLEGAKIMMTSSGSLPRGTWRHFKKNKEVVWMNISSHRIMYNNRWAILSVGENVTQRLLMEEQLRKSYDDIRLLNAHLETIREEERAGIAREIHDELGQQLTALKMDASWINTKLGKTEGQTDERITSMLSLIDDTVKTVRRIASDLRPGVLDDLGLVAAIEWQGNEFEKRTGIKTLITSQINEPEIDKKVATAIFRVYQEVLTNVARHAKASLVETQIELKDNIFRLSIKDNGVGFNIAEVKSKHTLGLLGMNERVAMVKGELSIESKVGEGTRVVIKVPIE